MRTIYRRHDVAKELLSKVVNEARGYGCGVVQITALDMGCCYIRILDS